MVSGANQIVMLLISHTPQLELSRMVRWKWKPLNVAHRKSVFQVRIVSVPYATTVEGTRFAN